MKIGFFSPYFDSVSGGERYLLTLASHWSQVHDVFLFWDDPGILSKSEKRLNINLKKIHTTENVFKTKNVFRKLAVSRGYDLIFFLTDGSIPTTFAKRNILHFQVPFKGIPVHPIKLLRFQAIVCNSFFTKDNLEPRIGKHSIVIYPPVESIHRQKVAKKNIILSVGRFHPLKKQDLLIEIFRKGKFKDYTLVLCGGLQPSDKKYFDSLVSLAKNLSVQLFPNVSYEKLVGLYNEARIYWHAAGYGETRPENMEHFGITTVEAMSAGCIPVVFRGGGLPEIVTQNLWTTPGECESLTQKVIRSVAARDTVRQDMIRRSKKFTVGAFTKSFDELLASITK